MKAIDERLDAAILDDDLETVKSLVGSADLNHRQSNGFRPLHLAAEIGNPVLIELLVERGAIVNCPVNLAGDSTPLHIAAMKGHTKAVSSLLALGANPFSGASIRGGTPIDFSSRTKPVHQVLQKSMNSLMPIFNRYCQNPGKSEPIR